VYGVTNLLVERETPARHVDLIEPNPEACPPQRRVKVLDERIVPGVTAAVRNKDALQAIRR
jgi:hypothetical protein